MTHAEALEFYRIALRVIWPDVLAGSPAASTEAKWLLYQESRAMGLQ